MQTSFLILGMKNLDSLDDINKYIEYSKYQYMCHVTAAGKAANKLVHFFI